MKSLNKNKAKEGNPPVKVAISKKVRKMGSPICESVAVDAVIADNSCVALESSTMSREQKRSIECRSERSILPSQGPVQIALGKEINGAKDDSQEKDSPSMNSTSSSNNSVVAKPNSCHHSLIEKINILRKQNEILARVMSAPHYSTMAARIFRASTVFHIGAVEQLFHNKGYGEDWLTVVTSALASSAGGEVTLVPFDVSLDAEVQRAVEDFPYTLDMELPLSQRAIGDYDRVIHDIFLLYEELKLFC